MMEQVVLFVAICLFWGLILALSGYYLGERKGFDDGFEAGQITEQVKQKLQDKDFVAKLLNDCGNCTQNETCEDKDKTK